LDGEEGCCAGSVITLLKCPLYRASNLKDPERGSSSTTLSLEVSKEVSMKKTLGLLVCLAGLWGATLPATAAVEDSVNADKAPLHWTYWSWDVDAVGWMYTPSFSYDLTGVQTKFGPYDPSRNSPMEDPNAPLSTITEEVYDAIPGQGGQLLRSAQFLASTNFAGGSFPSLSLEAGHAYFVEFRNIRQVAVNFTNDAGAAPLSLEYAEIGGTWVVDRPLPPLPNGMVPSQILADRPILRFMGDPIQDPSSAPEPAGLTLLGLGAAPLLRRRSGLGRGKRV
jgi:MYXO-CTERM domain-containing protein